MAFPYSHGLLMNFLELINTTRLLCGASGDDITSLSSQTKENRRYAMWVNGAYLDIQNMRKDWDWMRKSCTFPTVAGQGIYTKAQIGLTDHGFWKRYSFRNYANPFVSLSIGSPCVVSFENHTLAAGDVARFYSSGTLPTGLVSGTEYYVISPLTNTFQVSATAGGTPITTSGTQSGQVSMTSNNTTTFGGFRSEIFMDDLSYDVWRDAYEYGALRTIKTRPLSIAITPDKGLAVGPFPIDGYTIVGDYYSAPVRLVVETDTPILPEKFHYAIVYRAMISAGLFESAQEIVQRGESESDKWTRRMIADLSPEVVVGGPLV